MLQDFDFSLKAPNPGNEETILSTKSLRQDLGAAKVIGLSSTIAKECTKEGEAEPRILVKEDLSRLSSVIKRGLAPYDTLFYEVYSFTQSNGIVAGDGLDDPEIQEVLDDIPRELRIWVSGINKSGQTNRVGVYFSELSVLVKVDGHDKAWVETEYQRIITFLTTLRKQLA